MHGCSLFFQVIVWISEVPDGSLFFSKKKVADNSLFFASHSCRAWFLYVCFPGAYKISAVMQGAPPDQMGASYPHMFLILLLLHGANAASKAPAGPKWQTLSGILFLFFFSVVILTLIRIFKRSSICFTCHFKIQALWCAIAASCRQAANVRAIILQVVPLKL